MSKFPSWLVLAAFLASTRAENISADVARSLLDALNFVKHNVGQFNLDGIYGVVLSSPLIEHLIGKRLPENVTNILTNCHSIAEEIIQEAVPNLPTPEEKYEYFVKAFLDPKRWRQEVHFKFGALSPANYDGNLTSAEFDRYLNVVMGISETESDECMLDIVKSRNQSPDCVVSDMCNSVMVEDRRNQSSYGITHRLLYVQVARMLGCSRPEVWFEDCAKRFCSHILWESRTIANLGFNPSWDDLLLEQIVLCGLEGFQEFLNEDWAEHILHIQRPAGCFGPSPPSTGRRSKREMNYLTNDCTDHTTGLGVAGLTLFLEYFFKDY